MFIIHKVCYDKGGESKSKGARFGPEAIECVFKRISWRGAEDGTPHPELKWMPAVKSLTHYRGQAELVCAGKIFPFITLSGDNSCSFETVRAMARHIEHVALAVFDAHPDVCDLSHDSHANWVRRLWDEGIVKPEKTIFFGIRDAEEYEMRYLKEKKATAVSSDCLYALCATHVGVRSIKQYDSLWKPISTHGLVIVVDIDVLDPAYAPGTGVLRAGGLHVRHILRIIRDLCVLPFFVRAGEICEVIPEAGNKVRPQSDKRPDPCGLTVLAAEAIFREMIRSMSA